MTARAELTGTRDRAREMLLAQGAELSRASIALSQIFDRLEAYGPLLLEVILYSFLLQPLYHTFVCSL